VRRQITRIPVMTRCGLLPLALMSGLTATPAAAQVHVNVNIGATPPPIIVEAPPPMVFLSDPGVYVAVGVPYDIFFSSGRYYYFQGGNWFWGSGYGGPWTTVGYQTLSPGLRRYKVNRLREYREREYAVYRVQGPRFQGKHFYAEQGHGHDRDDDDRDDHDRDDHDRGDHDRGDHDNGHHKGHKKH